MRKTTETTAVVNAPVIKAFAGKSGSNKVQKEIWEYL